MTNFQKLKHEARRAEQRSDWGRAIDLYQRALDADEDMADLSLYNRIGDLHLRLTQNEAAVECYERAVDRYADNGMHTSAIALCNKILRIAPGRTSAYRRLALLHARSGLVAEGRSNLLTFVGHALDGGEMDEAVAAVEEFAELTGDEQVRLRFADVLEEREHVNGAADQLRVVYRQRRKRGSDAEPLRERLESLAPGSGDEDAEDPADDAAESSSGSPTVNLAAVVGEGWNQEEGGAAFEAAPAAPANADGPAVDRSLDGVRQELERFRDEVRDQLEGDATIRYDLGVELMTIGLLDEAMEEFHAAVADPALTEAANARIGECLALRTSGATFELRRTVRSVRPTFRLDDDGPAGRPTPEPVESASGPAPADEAGSPVPADGPGEPGADDAEANDEDDELQGHFFRARLAQYRIRQAEERHMTDHAAHVDLGNAYTGMGLFQEALRELRVALGGPRSVASRAARALERLATGSDAPPDVALEILERLAAADAGPAAERLASRLAADWGPEHPSADRLAELAGRLSEAVRDLPALEDMFPAMTDPGPTADGADGTDPPADPAVAIVPEDVATEAATEPRTEPVATNADETAGDVEQQLARIEDLVQEGRDAEAAEELNRTVVELQGEGRIREALRLLDRLLELRPDDVELHQQRAELAQMANDRATLIASYAGLGACLLRHDLSRRARAAYGRVLDVDPEHADARAAIADIDDRELRAEREAAAATLAAAPDSQDTTFPPADADSPATKSSADEAEVDALLEGLQADPDAVEAAAADGGDDPGARSHYELGLAFRQMGMWDEAARELRFALSGVADRMAVLNSLAECLVKAGRTADAVGLLNDNLRSDDDEAQIVPLYYLGLALQAEGDADAARGVLARVEAVRPGYRDTAERLSELSL